MSKFMPTRGRFLGCIFQALLVLALLVGVAGINPLQKVSAETSYTYWPSSSGTIQLVGGQTSIGVNISGVQHAGASIDFPGGSAYAIFTTPQTFNFSISYPGQIFYATQSDADAMINGCRDPIFSVSATIASLTYTTGPSWNPPAGVTAYDIWASHGVVSATYTIRDGVTNAVWSTWTANWNAQSNLSATASSANSSIWNGWAYWTWVGSPTTYTYYYRSYSVGSPVGPIITASPTLYKDLGDTVNWVEGITATWGITTTNTIPSMGTITDNTISGSPLTDTRISTGGTTYDRIGKVTHNYTVRDSTGDGSFTNTSRDIIVRTLSAPTIVINWGVGAIDPFTGLPLTGAYDGRWTNQPLSITISSSDPGAYDLVMRRGGANTTYRQSINSASGGSYTFTYHEESGVTGADLSAIMLASDNTVLSPESSSRNVKIDRTSPTPNATYNSTTGNFTDTSTDNHADNITNGTGIRRDLSKIALATPGNTPADTDYDIFTALNSSIIPGGYYDVWVWAWDSAGNNVKARVISNLQVLSSYAPIIGGELASGPDTGSPHPTDTWTNQDVWVEASPDPSGDTSGYVAIYDGSTQEAKGGAVDSSVGKLYTGETSGTTLQARLVDGSNNPLSQPSGPYVVKIDKTAPLGGLTFNANTTTPFWGFTDTSTDTLSPVGANSGINFGRTLVAIVSAGSAEPNRSSYILLSDASAVIPTTGYWDVWVIAIDIAGNESTPAKALSYISRSMGDSIVAKDFGWDIASGATALNNDVAIMMAHVYGIEYGTGNIFNAGDFIVNSTQLAAIHAAINAGQRGTTWDLTFYTPNSAHQAEITIKVTLFDNGPTPDPGGPGPNTPDPLNPNGPLSHEVIYGNDFNWGISNGNLTDAGAKILSNVTAYDVNGDPITAIAVNPIQLAAINAGNVGDILPLTFTTPDGTATTVMVTLFGNGSPPVSGKDNIVANDFAWGISNGNLTDNPAKLLSFVQGVFADGTLVPSTGILVDATQLAAINAAVAAGEVGRVLPLTFYTPAGADQASVTVNVTIFGNGSPPVSGKDNIVANDFAWGISNGSLTDNPAKILSFVQGVFADGTLVPSTGILVDATQLAAINAAVAAGEVGRVLPLTFYTPAGADQASVTVNVTIFGNGSPPVTGKDNIVANDFAWGISNGSLTGDPAKILSFVKGVFANGSLVPNTGILVDATQLAAINAAVAAGEVGRVLPLTFSTPAGADQASVTVNVTIFGNGSPPVAGKDNIVANDFAWGISNGSLTGDPAKILSFVKGVFANGSLVPNTSILVDATQLAAINAAIAAGEVGRVLPLTFSTPAGADQASVTVNVTIFGNGSPPVSGKDNIVANDFAWGISNGSLTDDPAKLLSFVQGIFADGSLVPGASILVDATQLAAINAAVAAGEVGRVLPLTFSTPAGADQASVTVNVTIFSSGSPLVAGNEHLVGNDFGWGITTGALTDNAAKQLSNVQGVYPDASKIDLSDIDVDATQLAAINAAITAGEIGKVLPLTFFTVAGTSVTVQVTLYGNGTTPWTVGDEYIVGNNFEWTTKDGAINADKAKEWAKVLAIGADGSRIDLNDIDVDPTELAAIVAMANARLSGVLPLTFTTNGATGNPASVTVMVTIKIPWTILYNGNGNTSGTAPVDTRNPYAGGDIVIVLGNTGNLAKTGYTFIGWSTDPNATVAHYPVNFAFPASGNITLYAVWKMNEYTVTYVDWDGKVLKTETVPHGGTGTPPENPSRPGYTFKGWTSYSNITGDTVVTAQYDVNTYTVTFVDWNGTVLRTETVSYGGSATAPANPSRTGYTFTGWTPSYNNITSNLTVTAQYTQNTYTVEFRDWDGTVLKTETVPYGGSATPPPNPSRSGYTFTGWSPSVNNITSNTVIVAQYTQNAVTPQPTEHTVVYKDWDGKVLKEEKVKTGEASTPPADPTREGYTFSGWSHEGRNVASDTTITAQYTQNPPPTKDAKSWALLNLVLAIIGVVVALVSALYVVMKKGRNFLWMLVATVLGVVGIIVFFVTQNMSNPMTMVDWWTLLHVVLAAIGMVAMVLAVKNNSEKQSSKKRA